MLGLHIALNLTMVCGAAGAVSPSGAPASDVAGGSLAAAAATVGLAPAAVPAPGPAATSAAQTVPAGEHFCLACVAVLWLKGYHVLVQGSSLRHEQS